MQTLQPIAEFTVEKHQQNQRKSLERKEEDTVSRSFRSIEVFLRRSRED